MKLWYLVTLLLCSCTTVPAVLPDNSRPSIMEESIKHNLQASGEPSYMWILWYIPILAVVLSWTWKTFIRKKTNEPQSSSECNL